MSVALIAQSGGPTPVINASLLGVVEEARRHPEISALYGARFGIAGVISQSFVDLLQQSPETLAAIARTPASALGSSRLEVKEQQLEQILAVLRAHEVRYFFYNGGNGSMGTASQIAAYARESGYELQVIGIPKTIDNDIVETDHTPGYASTARFFAHATRDIGADNRALPGQVEFIEILGRNVGWIVAATSLASQSSDDAPHLVYLPENPLPLEKLLDDVHEVYRRLGRCVVTVCEGQLDERGEPFGADVRSGSRGSLAMNLAHRLAMLVSERLKIRARSEKPGLLGRATSAYISRRDWDEARLCGSSAVRSAVNGASGKMVGLVRENQRSYAVKPVLVDLERVAFAERTFPSEWQNEAKNGILPAFRQFASPLIEEVTPFSPLKDIPIPKKTYMTGAKHR
jgi:6-phosphofructokinase